MESVTAAVNTSNATVSPIQNTVPLLKSAPISPW